MEKIQPVIDWFTDRGGKYIGGDDFVEIENSGNQEVQYRGLQIFIN